MRRGSLDGPPAVPSQVISEVPNNGGQPVSNAASGWCHYLLFSACGRAPSKKRQEKGARHRALNSEQKHRPLVAGLERERGGRGNANAGKTSGRSAW